MERPKPATIAWIGLGIATAVYEGWCPDGETLSEGFDRALENKNTRHIALGLLAVTAAHLANVLPEPIDPFEQGLSKIRRRIIRNRIGTPHE